MILGCFTVSCSTSPHAVKAKGVQHIISFVSCLFFIVNCNSVVVVTDTVSVYINFYLCLTILFFNQRALEEFPQDAVIGNQPPLIPNKWTVLVNSVDFVLLFTLSINRTLAFRVPNLIFFYIIAKPYRNNF